MVQSVLDCKCLHVSVPPVLTIKCMPILWLYSHLLSHTASYSTLKCFHRQLKLVKLSLFFQTCLNLSKAHGGNAVLNSYLHKRNINLETSWRKLTMSHSERVELKPKPQHHNRGREKKKLDWQQRKVRFVVLITDFAFHSLKQTWAGRKGRRGNHTVQVCLKTLSVNKENSFKFHHNLQVV